MHTLLRNADLFAPEPLGRRDLLLAGGRIAAISAAGQRLPALPAPLACEELDLAGARLVPGLIDAHVHVSGGGGEAGPATKVPPLQLSQLAAGGVTCVVGLLGTDGTTRSPEELVARTLALREEGLSAFCWTGSYELPLRTLTGSVRRDLCFVEPVIGVGELAVSDHRSSQPTFDELVRIAADCHVGGMLSGKAGVLHLHLGDGARGLSLVRRAIAETELPPSTFHPTHVNRNLSLFAEAVELAKAERGPCVDVTAFPESDDPDGLPAAEAIADALEAGVPIGRLTCSSDGGGCLPAFDGEGRLLAMDVGRPTTLLEALRGLLARGIPLELALLPFTANPARLLRLAGKGRIEAGAHADLLALDGGLRPLHLIARGRFLVRGGRAAARGRFETEAAP